jgi:hypothetical protein
MTAEIVKMIQWFARIGKHEYPPVPGTLAMLDLQRLRTDRNYGLKCFLTYMGARAGAPKEYVPAWLKALEKRTRVGSSFAESFRNFHHGGPNKDRNPMWDQQLANLDVPSCVEHVQRGELSTAFLKLKLRGAGHKIRALFLCDLAVFTDAEPADLNSWTIAEQYLYCQPIDIWVDLVADCLKIPDEGRPPSRLNHS